MLNPAFEEGRGGAVRVFSFGQVEEERQSGIWPQ